MVGKVVEAVVEAVLETDDDVVVVGDVYDVETLEGVLTEEVSLVDENVPVDVPTVEEVEVP